MTLPKLFQEKNEWLAVDHDLTLFSSHRLDRRSIMVEEVKRGLVKQMHLDEFSVRDPEPITLTFFAPRKSELTDFQRSTLSSLFSSDRVTFEERVVSGILELRKQADTYLPSDTKSSSLIEVTDIQIFETHLEGLMIFFYSDWCIDTPLTLLVRDGEPMRIIDFQEYKILNPLWNYGQKD